MLLSAATVVLPLYITLLSNCGSRFTFWSAQHKRIIHESVKGRAGASGVLQKGVSGVSEVLVAAGCCWCKGLMSLCVWRQNVLCEALIKKDTVQ